MYASLASALSSGSVTRRASAPGPVDPVEQPATSGVLKRPPASIVMKVRRSSQYKARVVASAGSQILEKDAEVLVQEDVGVEEDGALRDLPGAVDPAQHVLAAPGQELVIRFQVRAVHEKGRLGLHLAF